MELLEHLRTTEGTLFHYESSKKLFLDVKGLLFDSLDRGLTEGYQNYLKAVNLEKELKIALATCPDMPKRLSQVSLLYAKMTKIDNVKFQAPTVPEFLQCIFSAVLALKSVQSKDFLTMDVLKQDYILRDIFRKALLGQMEHEETKEELKEETKEETVVQREEEESVIESKKTEDQESNDNYNEIESPFISISARSEAKSVTSILSRHSETMKQLKPKKVQLESPVLE